MSDLDPGVSVLSESALADRIGRDKPVAVLFYADWCPFCAKFLPTFAERADDLPIPAVAANLSHPEDPRWDTYGVETIPTIIAFEAGNEIARVEAAAGVGLSGEELEAFAERLG